METDKFVKIVTGTLVRSGNIFSTKYAVASSTVAASVTYGFSLRHLRLQPPSPTVAGARVDDGQRAAHLQRRLLCGHEEG